MLIRLPCSTARSRRRVGAATTGRTFVLLLAGLPVIPAAVHAQNPLDPAAGRSVTIGVVRDGPSPGDTMLALIQRELAGLLASAGATFDLKQAPAFDAGWRADGMIPALRAALDDPERIGEHHPHGTCVLGRAEDLHGRHVPGMAHHGAHG